MTSSLVGTARIEITGDLTAFAAEAQARVEAAMAEVNATVTEGMGLAETKWAEGGRLAGTAYTEALTPTIAAGGAEAVTAGAATATEAAEVEYAGIGRKAGEKFSETARESVRGLGSTIFAGVGALGVAELLKGSIEQADQLEGATIKIEGAFGESAKGVESWAATMASKLGLSETAAENAAGTFGQMFHAMGIGEDQAATMSEHLSELVQNVARFNNADPASVQAAFTAAMRGRGKALMQLGINLDATTLANEALQHGLVKNVQNTTAVQKAEIGVTTANIAYDKVMKDSKATAQEKQLASEKLAAAEDGLKVAMQGKLPTLTQSQKGEAAYYAILDGTKNQENAVADSSHTLAQQKKILGAEVSNLEAKIGQGLLPILTRLSEWVTNDVLPAIESFGHWVVQNKEWIEPLAATLAGLAAAFVTVKIALAGFHAAQKVGHDIQSAYNAVAGAGRKLFGAGTTAEQEATTKVQQGFNTATSEGARAIERQGVAAATAAPEMDAYATSIAAAATAQEDLDAANRLGGGGGLGGRLGGAGKAAGAGEELGAEAEGVAAVGGEATTAEAALGGMATEGGAAATSLAGIAAIALPVAAIAALGVGITKLTGDGKKFNQVLGDINTMGVYTTQGVQGLTQAMRDDNDAFGVASATYVGTQLQQQGIADAAKAAGVSLGGLTAGVAGTDAQFSQMMTTLQASGALTHDQELKLVSLHIEYDTARGKAKSLTDQANDLNAAVAGFKPGRVTLTDGASYIIQKIKNELESIDGETVHVHVAADGTTTAQGGQGGKGVLSGVYGLGGPVAEGWGVVGDAGPELIYKDGSNVYIHSNGQMMRGLATGASGGSVAPLSGEAVSMSEVVALLRDLASRDVYLMADHRALAKAVATGTIANGRR